MLMNVLKKFLWENSSGKVVDYISLWRAFRRSVVKNPETEENSISDDTVIRDAILRCFSVSDPKIEFFRFFFV